MLPSIRTTANDSTGQSLKGDPTCKICNRQVSRYTCPKCNIPYCSLICYRSEAHGGCSEAFYKREVEVEIQTKPSATREERGKMMEMLQKFEESNKEDTDEDKEGEDLESRLENLDLDSASYESLWEVLTPGERDEFLRAVQDPESLLTQQLLQSEELKRQFVQPWWEAAATASSTLEKLDVAITRRLGRRPDIIPLKGETVTGPGPLSSKQPPLLFNLCAVCIAYAYTTRLLTHSPLSGLQNGSADAVEARRVIGEISPFLVEKRSKLLFANLEEVVTNFVSRVDGKSRSPSSLSRVLRDCALLISPRAVTEMREDDAIPTSVPDFESHPNSNVLRVLSDLVLLFLDPKLPGSSGFKETHVTMKLRFYIGFVFQVPPPLLRVICDEMLARAVSEERETNADSEHRSSSVFP